MVNVAVMAVHCQHVAMRKPLFKPYHSP